MHALQTAIFHITILKDFHTSVNSSLSLLNLMSVNFIKAPDTLWLGTRDKLFQQNIVI